MTNRRTDHDAGSLENRLRFLREGTDAWTAKRVGVRFSSLRPVNDMADDPPEDICRAAATGANSIGPAYVHLVDLAKPKPPVAGAGEPAAVFGGVRDAFDGGLVADGNYDLETATDASSRATPTSSPSGVPSSPIPTFHAASEKDCPATCRRRTRFTTAPSTDVRTTRAGMPSRTDAPSTWSTRSPNSEARG